MSGGEQLVLVDAAVHGAHTYGFAFNPGNGVGAEVWKVALGGLAGSFRLALCAGKHTT